MKRVHQPVLPSRGLSARVFGGLVLLCGSLVSCGPTTTGIGPGPQGALHKNSDPENVAPMIIWGVEPSYTKPALPPPTAAQMNLMASAGVTWIQTYGGVKIESRDDSVLKFLNSVADVHMKVIASVERIVNGRIDTAFLSRKVTQWRDHAAIGAWLLVDEPDVKRLSAADLANAYALCKRLDPSRPVVVVWAAISHSGVAEDHGRTFDWAAVDLYPIGPAVVDRDAIVSRVSEVRAWLKLDGRPLIPILQAFEDSRHALPTDSQVGWMFDDFRTAGATSGAAFYSWNSHKGPKNLGASELWPGLLKNLKTGRFRLVGSQGGLDVMRPRTVR